MTEWIAPLVAAFVGGAAGAVLGPLIKYRLDARAKSEEITASRNARIRGEVERAAADVLLLRLAVARGGGRVGWVDFWLKYAGLRAAIPRITDVTMRDLVQRLYERLEALQNPGPTPADIDPATLDDLVNAVRLRMDALNWPEADP